MSVPESSMRRWHRLFFVNRRRLQNFIKSGAVDPESDAPRLTQVLVNLLANANKFGPEGSTVTLRARHEQAAQRPKHERQRAGENEAVAVTAPLPPPGRQPRHAGPERSRVRVGFAGGAPGGQKLIKAVEEDGAE